MPHPYLSEFIGTFLLILLGTGVVANVVLNKTKGNNSGWIVITFGWAMAVFIAVTAASNLGGPGHLNPAITIAFAATSTGEIQVSEILTMIGCQLGGAMLGAIVSWVIYKQHFDATEDKELKLAVFATGPAIRNTASNLTTEMVGTFVLVLGAITMSSPMSVSTMGSLRALPVGLLVLGIGLSLGGPTGYAINPARDFGPRLVHAILPIKNKRDSDWSYAWIPIVGPIIGAVAAALIYYKVIVHI